MLHRSSFPPRSPCAAGDRCAASGASTVCRALLLLTTLGALVETTNAHAADGSQANPEGPPLYFLNDVDYGSDSEFNPVQATIHLSYDILRNASYQDSPFKMAYATGFGNVGKSLIHPFDTIEKAGGAAEFIAHE